MHPQGHQRDAFFRGGLGEFVDLSPIGQQDAVPNGLVLEVGGGVGILADVHVVQRQLGRIAIGAGKALGEVDPSEADAILAFAAANLSIVTDCESDDIRNQL